MSESLVFVSMFAGYVATGLALLSYSLAGPGSKKELVFVRARSRK